MVGALLTLASSAAAEQHVSKARPSATKPLARKRLAHRAPREDQLGKPEAKAAVTPPKGAREALAQPGTKAAAKARPPCLQAPVELSRGSEQDRFSLTRCDGNAAPQALEHLSMLARPNGGGRPELFSGVDGRSLAATSSARKLDPTLLVRLQAIVDHFTKKGETARIELISGYRPNSGTSYHASGRALDFRLEGVTNEALVAFCKTLPDSGCGYYPNSSFVHLDVRPPGTGHIAWIDASGPGESPRYVASWPPPAGSTGTEEGSSTEEQDRAFAALTKALPPLEDDAVPPPPLPEFSQPALK